MISKYYRADGRGDRNRGQSQNSSYVLHPTVFIDDLVFSEEASQANEKKVSWIRFPTDTGESCHRLQNKTKMEWVF